MENNTKSTKIVAAWAIIAISAILACLSEGCTTIRYVPFETTRTDSVYVSKVMRDTVREKDSISVFVKGDTVRLERFRTKYIIKERFDTIRKTDSIPVPFPQPYEVEKRLTWWQKLRMDVGLIAIALALAWAVWRIRKLVP